MAKTSSAATSTVPPPLTNPDNVQAYQDLYDALGRAYWDASDINSKDTIQGAREAVYAIITNLNEAQLEANTTKFLAIVPTIKSANDALANIQRSINNITKNINTAGVVLAAISKVLSLTSGL
jgi:hypothetical protein